MKCLCEFEFKIEELEYAKRVAASFKRNFMHEMFCCNDIVNVEGNSNLTKLVKCLCKFGYKIEKLESTKLKIHHGDGT